MGRRRQALTSRAGHDKQKHEMPYALLTADCLLDYYGKAILPRNRRSRIHRKPHL